MTDEKGSTNQTSAASAQKVEKPNRDEFDKAVAALDAEIKRNQAIIDEVKKKFDDLKAEKEKASTEKEKRPDNPEFTKLNELRAVTKKLSEERKALIEKAKKSQAERDAARDKFEEARKKLKEANVPSQEALDRKIRDLEFHMTTTSLNLREEKQCMSDIRNLNASRKVFGELDAAKAARDQAEAASKELQAKLDETKAAVEKARAEEEAQSKLLAAKKENRPKSEVPDWIAKRDKARAELNRLYPALNALRTEFHAKENEFRKYMNEKRKEQQKKYEEEQAKYREEQKARQLQRAEEEFEFLHAEKFAAIDRLVAYLKSVAAAETEEEKEDDKTTAAAPAEENLIGKIANALQDDIYGTKKAAKAKAKKKAPKKKSGLVHDLNVLAEFSQLKVDAPLSAADIPAAAAALEKKREELKQDKQNQFEKHQQRKAAIAAGQVDEEAKPKQDGAADGVEVAGDGVEARREGKGRRGNKGGRGKKEATETTEAAGSAPATVEAAV